MSAFDQKTANRLSDVYRSVDVVERRLANFKILAPAIGETIVDLGCGPGFLSEELAGAVGPNGYIIAIDPSDAMRETAAVRLAACDNVTVKAGTATHLPLDDNTADGVVAIQVMEYVSDLPAALIEIKRVLKPHGRLVIGDIHYGSAIWYSRDPDRMRRLMNAWTDHVIDTRLAEHLAEDLIDQGFVLERQEPLVMMTTRPKADSFPMSMADIGRKSAVRGDHLSQAEVDALDTEQKALAAKGAFFFSITHYVTRARKPG